MDFQDRTLQCGECGADFVFQAREQQFYADKGFGDPKRCPDCRRKKKDERRANQKKTTITCAQCGTQDEVNFVPREGGRPVLCGNCFRASKQS